MHRRPLPSPLPRGDSGHDHEHVSKVAGRPPPRAGPAGPGLPLYAGGAFAGYAGYGYQADRNDGVGLLGVFATTASEVVESAASHHHRHSDHDGQLWVLVAAAAITIVVTMIIVTVVMAVLLKVQKGGYASRWTRGRHDAYDFVTASANDGPRSCEEQNGESYHEWSRRVPRDEARPPALPGMADSGMPHHSAHPPPYRPVHSPPKASFLRPHHPPATTNGRYGRPPSYGTPRSRQIPPANHRPSPIPPPAPLPQPVPYRQYTYQDQCSPVASRRQPPFTGEDEVEDCADASITDSWTHYFDVPGTLALPRDTEEAHPWEDPSHRYYSR